MIDMEARHPDLVKTSYNTLKTCNYNKFLFLIVERGAQGVGQMMHAI
jgi:hypothetical protein